MTTVVTAPSQTPAARQALNEANFQRNLEDRAPLAGEELERLNLRQQASQRREAQLQALDAALSEQEARADDLADTLRVAGLHDVAERARRSGRRQAFNTARRGIAGGSADIEQQEELAARSRGEAREVTRQAELAALQESLKALQSRDKLAGEVIRADPFAAQAQQTRLAGVQRQGDIDQALRDLDAQLSGLDTSSNQILAGAAAGALGSLGGVGGAALRGSA